jgi:hypothetical protein
VSENELGQILKQMYEKAGHGKQVVNIHLFEKYASIILKNNYNIKNIVSLSGLNLSYATKVSKGIKL